MHSQRGLRRRLAGLLVLSAGLLGREQLVAAAVDSEGAGVRSSSRIRELHLFTVPAALNLDAQPGPDGFEVRVYASTPERAKGIPITQGNLQIVMWDGLISGSGSLTNQPLHVWTFKPDDLKRSASTTSLGVGYRLTLRWEKDMPKQDGFTVAARFVPSKGPPVHSSTSGILLRPK